MSSAPRRRSVILSDTDYDYHTDYYDVEYVKSNGTGNNNTWIDTNVEMTWNIIVDTKVYGHYTYWDKVFHAAAAGGDCEFQMTNKLGGYYGGSVWTYSSGSVGTDTEFIINIGQGRAIINGGTVTLKQTTFTTTNHIYLLGNKVDGSVMRMYYCKIYNGTTLIRDMIPVKKKANNEYGFWDLITNKFYGNGGTVPLSGGDIIPPDQTYYCYYYGDECEEVTGGWQKVWGSTAQESWITVTKNTDNIAIGSTCTGASYDYRVGLATKKPIDGYGKDVRLFCYAKVGGTYPQSWYHVLSGRSAIRDLHQSYYDGDYHEWQSGTIGNGATADYVLGVGSIIDPTHTSTNWNYDIRLAQTNFGGTTYIKAMGYAFGDDLSGLSAYGDNDTRILGKMEAIMANNTARNYLLKQCSGSLMWACVNNSVFRDAVQRSGHLADFTSHSRWSKAMNMAGTWTAKSAHPGAEPLTNFDQLEYITEQNNAFINTKYVPTNTSGFEVVASKSTSDTTTSVLLGSKEYNNSRWLTNIVQTVNFGWNTDLTGPSYTANSKITIKLNYLNDRKMSVNDTQVATISSSLDAQNKAVAYIFGYNNNGNESSMNVNAKIYSVKISENGQVVKEFIPVKRKSDSEVGMYEKIGGIFYGNISKTTGSTFVAGPKIEPVITGYTQLEYIESTGTQYINTNYIPLAADKFIMDFQTVSTTNAFEAIFGARQGSYLYKAYCFFVRFAGSNYYRFSRSGAETLLNNGMYNKRVTLTTQNKTASWTDGSTTYSGSTTGTVEDCTNALFLFNLNTAGAGGAQVDISPSEIKLYSFEVVRDGSTIHKYIPMKRDSDGAIGLYDQINQVFLTNAGSGTFTPGPEIHPTEDKVTFYDYIDITGGGKIPTGIYPNSSNTMNCYMDVEVPDLTHRYCLLTTYENESSHYNCFELNVNSQKRVVTRLSTDTSAIDNTSTAIDGLRHKFHLYCTGNTYRIDNWQTTNNRAITTTNKPYTIGSDYRSSTSPFNTIRVFSCKIIENNIVVRDLVPAKNTTNNKWCLYDKINKVCYYDVGNGTVSGGNLEKAITGYQLVDWIQNTNDAYADLDYKNFDEIKFMADCKFQQTDLTPTDKWHLIFCSKPTLDDYHLMGLGYASNQVAGTRTLRGFSMYTDFQLYFSNVPVGDTALREGFIEANAFGVNGIIDDTFKTTAKTKSSFTNTNSMKLFTIKNGYDADGSNFKGKIYKFKLYNEGKPVIDLAPVKRISDGVYGFYDRIRSRFFSSATSTAFTGGYTVTDKLFTATDFNAGTFENADRSGSHSVITSLYAGTDGFSLIGTSSKPPGGTGGVMAKWYTSVDLTGYSKITFSGCKVVNHGIVYVQVIDTSTSTAVKTVSVAYGSLVANTWYDYEIDVTELSGTYKLQFIGGYWDASGNTTSQTRYANIKLIV